MLHLPAAGAQPPHMPRAFGWPTREQGQENQASPTAAGSSSRPGTRCDARGAWAHRQRCTAPKSTAGPGPAVLGTQADGDDVCSCRSYDLVREAVRACMVRNPKQLLLCFPSLRLPQALAYMRGVSCNAQSQSWSGVLCLDALEVRAQFIIMRNRPSEVRARLPTPTPRPPSSPSPGDHGDCLRIFRCHGDRPGRYSESKQRYPCYLITIYVYICIELELFVFRFRGCQYIAKTIDGVFRSREKVMVCLHGALEASSVFSASLLSLAESIDADVDRVKAQGLWWVPAMRPCGHAARDH